MTTNFLDDAGIKFFRRANDDLSRSLMKVINEFRKHHQWRMQYGIIDAGEASEE